MANNIVLKTGGSGSELEVQKDDASVANGISILNFEDTGSATLTVINEGSGKITISVGVTETPQNLWATFISGSGSTTADTPADTLTISGGNGISTNIIGDTLTITNTSPNVNQNLFQTVAVAGQSNVVADSATDILTLVGSNGIAITTNAITDTVTIARTNNLLSRHNGVVTQTFGVTPITIQFGTNIRTDSNYTYNASGDVTINTSGWYRVTYDISIESTSGSARTSSTIWLENNTVEVSGTRAYGYHRNSNNGLDTASGVFFLNLTATNVIRVRTNLINGANLSTVSNGCRLTLEYIGV